MVKSYSRGHQIYFDEINYYWIYLDNDEIDDDIRPCKECNCYPTKEGYDVCLGFIENATSAFVVMGLNHL